MKKPNFLWSLWGFATTSLLGTVLHFLFDLTKKSTLVAPFSGVNESTWEHMKLFFWPFFVFTIIEYFFFKSEKCFLSIKLRALLIGLISIPVLFYTYNGVIGKSPDFINIAIFFVSAFFAYLYEYRTFKKGDSTCKNKILPLVIFILIGASFVVFTFLTPELAIFKDPITGTFGI